MRFEVVAMRLGLPTDCNDYGIRRVSYDTDLKNVDTAHVLSSGEPNLSPSFFT